MTRAKILIQLLIKNWITEVNVDLQKLWEKKDETVQLICDNYGAELQANVNKVHSAFAVHFADIGNLVQLCAKSLDSKILVELRRLGKEMTRCTALAKASLREDLAPFFEEATDIRGTYV